MHISKSKACWEAGLTTKGQDCAGEDAQNNARKKWLLRPRPSGWGRSHPIFRKVFSSVSV